VDEGTPGQLGWTESVTLGCKDFVEKVKEMLGRRVHAFLATGPCPQFKALIFLVIPTQKWLPDRNLIQQEYISGFFGILSLSGLV
jgi:hypothetical protein